MIMELSDKTEKRQQKLYRWNINRTLCSPRVFGDLFNEFADRSPAISSTFSAFLLQFHRLHFHSACPTIYNCTSSIKIVKGV